LRLPMNVPPNLVTGIEMTAYLNNDVD